MDSGCGTCTTELTSVLSSVVSRTVTSEPTVDQSSANSSYHQSGLVTATQPASRQPAASKPQRRQLATSQYVDITCVMCHVLHLSEYCSVNKLCISLEITINSFYCSV